ncbi:hypothetical protein DFR74_104206 [Nocardia puris]|uniref:IrrE N-terminal-like domain-containing protein n=1 Tax=Nocardia puris TaxID=208602 RepID=A0A366DQE6_9NOCA|nr:hypothetical protein DFR74_104206 [Nocardia puris]
MRNIEERFDDLLRAVPIPVPWDLGAYVSAVAEYRARPITLHPVSMSGVATAGCGGGGGLWIVRRDDDLIAYDDRTSDRHAEHIVLHEVGHMLLGHDRAPAGTDTDHGLLRELLPSVSAEAIHRVLGRDAYANAREREAEMFADLAMVRAQSPAAAPSTLRATFFRGRQR